MTWKKWSEALWYNMNTGNTLKYICETDGDTIINIGVFLILSDNEYLARDFATEAEARAFIEEFIK